VSGQVDAAGMNTRPFTTRTARLLAASTNVGGDCAAVVCK
jgi:hypothetical protein